MNIEKLKITCEVLDDEGKVIGYKYIIQTAITPDTGKLLRNKLTTNTTWARIILGGSESVDDYEEIDK